MLGFKNVLNLIKKVLNMEFFALVGGIVLVSVGHWIIGLILVVMAVTR